jgi:hypothetical protein
VLLPRRAVLNETIDERVEREVIEMIRSNEVRNYLCSATIAKYLKCLGANENM